MNNLEKIIDFFVTFSKKKMYNEGKCWAQPKIICGYLVKVLQGLAEIILIIFCCAFFIKILWGKNCS
ncbi:hypothetical protein DR097_00770 [Mycoplasma hyopneumoniae]|nr:hypothetical protein [Mesomycoplasma hyopneumoniae]